MSPLAQSVARRMRGTLAAVRGHQRRWSREIARDGRVLVVGGVTALHLAFLWIIVASLRLTSPAPPHADLQAFMFPSPVEHKVPLPAPSVVLPAVMEPPDVVIEDDDVSSAPAVASAALVLAPKPDPSHANILPTFAALGADGTSGALVVLKVQVTPDGAVGDASLVRSCGRPDIDLAVIRYVEANWRYIPAKLGEKAIEYWTTIAVPIGVAG